MCLQLWTIAVDNVAFRATIHTSTAYLLNSCFNASDCEIRFFYGAKDRGTDPSSWLKRPQNVVLLSKLKIKQTK